MSRAARAPQTRQAPQTPQAPPFKRSLSWSAAIHAVLLGLAVILPRLNFDSPPPFEIEITSPFLGDGPARLGAPKRLVPGVPAKVNVAVEAPAKPVPTTIISIFLFYRLGQNPSFNHFHV